MSDGNSRQHSVFRDIQGIYYLVAKQILLRLSIVGGCVNLASTTSALAMRTTRYAD